MTERKATKSTNIQKKRRKYRQVLGYNLPIMIDFMDNKGQAVINPEKYIEN